MGQSAVQSLSSESFKSQRDICVSQGVRVHLPGFSQETALEDRVQGFIATLAKAQPQHRAVITGFVENRGQRA